MSGHGCPDTSTSSIAAFFTPVRSKTLSFSFKREVDVQTEVEVPTLPFRLCYILAVLMITPTARCH